jgi:hypothetical protein
VPFRSHAHGNHYLAVDCVGSWVDQGCPGTCGAALVQTSVYKVTRPAANFGQDCPFADGATNTTSCNLPECPGTCVADVVCAPPCETTVEAV